MLPQARVANVKGAGMNARLVNAIERGARGFDDQDTALNARARLTLAIDLAAKQLRGQNKLFNPDQPRDDHGRWMGGGDPGSSTSNSRGQQVASGYEWGSLVAEFMTGVGRRCIYRFDYGLVAIPGPTYGRCWDSVLSSAATHGTLLNDNNP